VPLSTLRSETKWAGVAVSVAVVAGFLLGLNRDSELGATVGLLLLAGTLTGFGWVAGRGVGMGVLLATGGAAAGLGVLILWAALVARYAALALSGRPPAAVHGDLSWQDTLFLVALIWGCVGMVLGAVCGVIGVLLNWAVRWGSEALGLRR